MVWDRENVYDIGRMGGGQGIPSKGKENFLHDYQKAIDFMAEHGFNGIIVWGFLRDSHGGVEAARQLCDYGREKNVRIILGVGINSYGGFYYQGDHESNLNRWFAEHPDLRAIDAKGRPLEKVVACPSKRETQDWHRQGMEWFWRVEITGFVTAKSAERVAVAMGLKIWPRFCRPCWRWYTFMIRSCGLCAVATMLIKNILKRLRLWIPSRTTH